MDQVFKFQQFEVMQDMCAMKVGTDSVLLGGWAKPPQKGLILDIGAGTGILSLMMAQRTSCQIYAVEIDPEAAQQARGNFQASKWKDRLTCECADIKKFTGHRNKQFDYIISNPPYFNTGNRSVDSARAAARHSDGLSLRQLFNVVGKVLGGKGSFSLIIPYELRKEAICCALNEKLWLCREARIRPRPNDPYVRILLELQRKMPEAYLVEDLAIEEGRHNYTARFKEYTSAFYL